MTREEIARVIAQSNSAALSEAIDAFLELARETEAFSDLQVVTVYLKHVRAVADSQLAKLHQDAGNEPVSVPYKLDAGNVELVDHLRGMASFITECAAGAYGSFEQDVAALNAGADALERGSQVGDGWVLVPREPTPAMLLASEFLATGASRDDVIADYRAMLAAAPAHGGGG